MNVTVFALPIVLHGTPTGSSQLAIAVAQVIQETSEHLLVETGTTNLARLLDQLEAIREEAYCDGWDGAGSLAVTDATLYMARQFAMRLPRFVSMPEVSADPDGELRFEWYQSLDRVLAVAISNAGRLSYSASFSAGSGLHGTDWLSHGLPTAIVHAIMRVTDS